MNLRLWADAAVGAGAILLVSSVNGHAISRYDSKSLTCREARQIVASQGAVIFRYPSGRNPELTLYNRFVAHAGFCAFGERTASQPVPTSDRSCRLFICAHRNGYDGDR